MDNNIFGSYDKQVISSESKDYTVPPKTLQKLSRELVLAGFIYALEKHKLNPSYKDVETLMNRENIMDEYTLSTAQDILVDKGFIDYPSYEKTFPLSSEVEIFVREQVYNTNKYEYEYLIAKL